MTQEKCVWVLCDDRAGNVSQCLGVAETLGLPFVEKTITYNALGGLPNFLLGANTFGITAESKGALVAPWPDLVIAAGRRTAPVARYIKRHSGGKARLVQIMDPGTSGADDFDLICIPAHDAKEERRPNEMTIFGAPHRVTPARLAEAAQVWQERFQELPEPRIGLIVGGATKNKSFTSDMGRELGQQVNKMAEAEGGSVLVTTSRRTGEAASAILSEIKVPSFQYRWGDKGDNPYFGLLACSDMLVVTGDSVSMCSECCATGKAVYIYAPEGMVSAKHKRMGETLINGGYAMLFDGQIGHQQGKILSAVHDIVERIQKDIF